MRGTEPEPEVIATLEAVDATLAGEPIDPAFAEVAELALLLRAQRPVPSTGFIHTLDGRVLQRFKPSTSVQNKQAKPRRMRRLWWSLAPLTCLAAVVALVVVAGSGGGGSSASSSSAVSESHAPSVHSPHPSRAPSLALKTPLAPLQQSPVPAAPGLHVPNNGRKQVQSSQLTLGATPRHIDAVAQQVFNVVGEQNGFVDSSQVTASGTGGYAHFQLSVPSVSLPQTMSDLSSVRYATVLSRTDSVEDVTSQYRNDVRHHKKAALKALQRKISYSQITVTIQADTPPPPHRAAVHHSGFSIGSAARTALHVLTVVAGVALIALAVLVPLALVGGLAWWIASALKRRRREQALDMA
jgi:hypothetical protein